MGKKSQNIQPGSLCKKDENRKVLLASSRGLFSVFDLWQTCSNQSLKLVSGSEYPKRILKDNMESKKPRVAGCKRTMKALMDEESSKEEYKFRHLGLLEKKQKSDEQRSSLSDENKEAEAFINKALKKYLYKDRRNNQSQRFLDALEILKSNEELFLKMMQDSNSLLAKHIRNLQELHAENERSKLACKPKSSREELGTQSQKQKMYNLVLGRIRTQSEYSLKLKGNHQALRQEKLSEDINCHCSSRHTHTSKNKNYIVEPLNFSTKTKSKYTKGDEGKDLKGCIQSDSRLEIVSLDNNISNISSSSLRCSKGRGIDIVEEEAKRHLSVMLKNLNRKKCFPDKESPRMLGKILHLPQHRIFNLEIDKLRNRSFNTDGHEGISSMADGISSTDQMEIVKSIHLSQSDEQSIDTASSNEKNEDSVYSEQVSPSQYQLLIPGLDDSSPTPERVERQESRDCVRNRTDLLSPVSVLEPLLLDDLNSPPSTKIQSGNSPIHPMRIDFDEPSLIGSSPNVKFKCESSFNELELISKYIDALLQTSSLSWDEPYSSDQFFDPNLIDEVMLPPICYCDHKLLFDCINEAVSEVYRCYSKSSLFVSLTSLKPVPKDTSVADETKRKVYQYFCPRVMSKTIEQLAGEDHLRSHIWIDFREDIVETTVQVVESIVEELVRETICEI